MIIPRKCDCQSSCSWLLKSLWPYLSFHSYDKFTCNGYIQAYSPFSDWFFARLFGFFIGFSSVSIAFSLETPTLNGLNLLLVLYKAQNLQCCFFLAVINFVLSDFEDSFKYVDNLSVFQKCLIENFKVFYQSSDAIMSNFKDQFTTNRLQINKGKTKILHFNPLMSDLVSPPPYYPSVSLAVILGVTCYVDCLFNTLQCIPLSYNVVLVFLCPNLRQPGQFLSMLALYGALKSTTPVT